MSSELKGHLMHLMAGNMSCQDLADLMTEYLEGSMSFSEQVRFQIHLGFCRGCRNYLNQMKATIRTVGKLPVESIPDEIRDELLERFRTWKKS